MENKIYNEQNGLWYEKLGDYFLPCLTLSEEENQPVGVLGQRHARYLKEHRKAFYPLLFRLYKVRAKMPKHLRSLKIIDLLYFSFQLLMHQPGREQKELTS